MRMYICVHINIALPVELEEDPAQEVSTSVFLV